jgi:hypothetical protein
MVHMQIRRNVNNICILLCLHPGVEDAEDYWSLSKNYCALSECLAAVGPTY